MIEKLTKEQESKFKEYVDKWTSIGLCTKRANRILSEKHCRDAYRVAGLEEPKFIFWAESPMGLLLTAKLIKKIAAKGYKPYSEMDLNSVRVSVRDSVWDSVWASVRASVWDSVGGSVGDSGLRGEWNEAGSWGQHDANWLGFYDYFRNVLDLKKETEKLIPLTELSKETGWHLFYKNVAILLEKPTEIYRDDRGRLHKDGGPAIKWNDGYELYRLNGVNIPEWMSTKKSEEIGVQDVLKLTNAEQRLLGIKKIGPERMLKHLKAKKIDKKKKEYVLYEVELEGSKERLLQMQNQSEDKVHYEYVLPECNTVNEALLWRLGYDDFKTRKFVEPLAKT